MKFEKTLVIPKKQAEFIRKALSSTDMIGEDDTVTNTASFDNGIEMDIKLCGAREEHPWAEAVIFHSGSEVAFTEPAEDYDGDWELDYNGSTYMVHVVFSAEDSNASEQTTKPPKKASTVPAYALTQDEVAEVLKQIRR